MAILCLFMDERPPEADVYERKYRKICAKGGKQEWQNKVCTVQGRVDD
jgi:hypothetical protein